LALDLLLAISGFPFYLVKCGLQKQASACHFKGYCPKKADLRHIKKDLFGFFANKYRIKCLILVQLRFISKRSTIMKLELDSTGRQYLKGLAHNLSPVVMIGGAGLTESVMNEINTALTAHELIKVRVFGDDRAVRVAMYEQICDTLEAAPIQHIGKLMVLFRPATEPKIEVPKTSKGTLRSAAKALKKSNAK
jgi:RNA-binding protein